MKKLFSKKGQYAILLAAAVIYFGGVGLGLIPLISWMAYPFAISAGLAIANIFKK